METLTDSSVMRQSQAKPGALSRIAANVAAAASVIAGKATIAIGVRRPPEGWRRTVGILLRGESTRFALSAFGLRVPHRIEGVGIEQQTARALQAFLASEPDAHFSLDWQDHVTVRRRLAHVDVVLLRFRGDGTLDGIEPTLASSGPPSPGVEVQARVHDAMVTAYNRTVQLPEVERPRRLLDRVRQSVGSADGQAYATRVLSACCVSFEAFDSIRRFGPPEFASRRTLGFGYLSCVARPAGDGVVDLWVSAHHVGLDGVPLQDLLGRLEQDWGTDAVTFPAVPEGVAFSGPRPCQAPGERAVDQICGFVHLSPVLELRRELTARHRAEIGGDVTLGALIAWLLSQEPEFRGVRIASTVDVKASGGYERDVDVVPLRPADFANGNGPWGGFVEFVREFNRLIAASRNRTSPLRVGMQTAGLLPAWAHATVIRSDPASLDDTFGSLCVTIVREAKVFVAPMTDLGLGHGFIAIGSADLPSADGRRVASVSVKGDAGRIAHYPEILRRVLARAAAAGKGDTQLNAK